MSSPTPIITKPPRKNSVSLIPQGINSIGEVAKQYSTYAWGAVAALPEVYTQVLALGVIPDKFKVALWCVAAVGMVAKFIKQRREEV